MSIQRGMREGEREEGERGGDRKLRMSRNRVCDVAEKDNAMERKECRSTILHMVRKGGV